MLETYRMLDRDKTLYDGELLLSDFYARWDDYTGIRPRSLANTPKETQEKLNRAVQLCCTGLAATDPSQVAITKEFHKYAFIPVLPSSFLIPLSRSRNRLIKCVATIALVVEVIFREILSTLFHLSSYFIRNTDHANMFRFRIQINRHAPLRALLAKLL